MMAKQSFIAVVGSANVDLTTFNDVFPRPGETIFGKKFDLGFGGKGANQAVAARFCGANVGMVAKVGSDLFGPATIKNLESQGIDATYVRIAAPLLRKADTIVMQFEIPLRTVYHTVKFAKTHGIRCIVNPAPAQPVDYKEAGAADYFIPNESEAEAITGMPVDSLDDARKCAEFMVRQGMRRVVITLGERGSLAAGPDRMELIPAFKVQAVDTTGAGDAFIGSFAVFLSEGLPEEEALPRASLYAALSTTKVGTQKSFCNRAEFEMEWRNRGGRL
jgi:ribokinase